MMKQHWCGGGLVSIFAAALVLSGCSKEYAELSEKPPEQVNAALATTAQSFITLNVLFPYEMISKALTDAVPESMPIEGRQRKCETIKILLIGQPVCLDVDYKATIKRTGSATITPLTPGLRVSLPVAVDGHAGFAGDLAKILKLDKKNFRGAINGFADVEMGVSEDWCPSIKVKPGFEWTNKAQLEIMHNFWLDVDSQAGPSITQAMDDAANKIPGVITCQRVKDLVAPAWHTYEVPLPAIMGQAGSVTITPQRVGFSGVNYTPAGAQLAIMLTAETQVKLNAAGATAIAAAPAEVSGNKPTDATKPDQLPIQRVALNTPAGATTVSTLDSKPLVLPKLEKIPAQQNSLNLAVPVLASYQSIDQMVTAKAVGKVFTGSAAGRTATAKILKTTVYPSGDRLVVGIQFESTISEPKSLAPQGWVYLVAKPQFDVATQTLTLANVDFSRAIDNDVWNALSFLFQSQIKSALIDAVKLDLRNDITKTRAELRKQLLEGAAKAGINMTLDDQFVGVTGLALTKEGIQVVLTLKGAANIIVLNKSA